VRQWTQQGLVDFLVACPFLTTDFSLPIAEMRELTGGRVPIFGGFDFGHGPQNHGPESAARRGAWGCTAAAPRGVRVQLPVLAEYLSARPWDWLAGLESPAGATRKPLLYSVAHSMHRLGGIDLPGQLPAGVAPGGSSRFRSRFRQPRCRRGAPWRSFTAAATWR